MVYDETLAARIRPLMKRKQGFSEKKMFGGVGLMLHGNMCVGIWKDSLIVRIGLDQYETALEEPDVREFDITGRVMRGWVMVEPRGLVEDEEVKYWVEQATKFVRTLPRK